MRAEEYRDIGLYLKDSRESLRISPEQAARDLHIRPKYIRAIEAGQLDDLPGKAYIRGYIRNYVEYLGLDAEAALAAYEALLADKKQKFFIPEPTLKQNMPSRRLLIVTLLGLAGIYFYWYFSVHQPPSARYDTPDLPPELAALLDKNHFSGMDTQAANTAYACLKNGNVDCYLSLKSHLIPAPEKMLYDTVNTTPPKP